jgi:hypothetical protein
MHLICSISGGTLGSLYYISIQFYSILFYSILFLYVWTTFELRLVSWERCGREENPRKAV